jgi:acetyltransferase-like isoleucine patch superfamily enzyme
MRTTDIFLSFLGRLLGKNIGRIKYIKDKAATTFFCSKVSCVGRKAIIRWPLYLYGEKYIQVGDSFSTGPGLRIECFDSYLNEQYRPKLQIGNNVTLNYYCHIGCINQITIGDDVLIGSSVLITDHSHGLLSSDNPQTPWAKRKLLSKGPVIIGNNVWIGENSCILPGVTIGDGCIIGAGSIVTHNIPAYSIAAGNPAKIVKQICEKEDEYEKRD